MKSSTTFMVSAAALGGLIAVGSMASAPAGFWAPAGFVEQADRIIQDGHLRLVCAEQDSIVVSFPSGSPEEDFYNASYLRADVRSFNRSPDAARSPFLIEGCSILGVDPFYHRVDLPYNRLPRWQGDVHFTFEGRTATLEGGADQELEIRHPLDRGDAALGSTRIAPDLRNARAYTSLLRLTQGGVSREVLADAFFVGENAVLADRRDVGSASVLRVNGFRTPPGRLLRLESGDWVQIGAGSENAAPATYLAETGDRARTASFVRVRNDRVERLFPAERLRPWLEPFSRAMDLALQSIPDAVGGGLVDADVRLTLDRGLSDAVDADFADWCEDRRHPSRPRAASAIVMDAFTGAVRAMPSCPGAPELAPFEPLSSRTRERFLRNQNLVPHPVGSAAKPFWTAAIATTYPNLLDLQIPEHAAGATEAVLGCPLDTPYNDNHSGTGWTGVEEYLQRSCNRYVVQLASAALVVGSEETGLDCREVQAPASFARCLPTPTPEPGVPTADGDDRDTNRLRFCDTVVNTVLAPGLEVVGGSCGDLQLVDAKFAPGPRFSALANVSVYRDLSPGASGGGSGPALGEQYRLGRYRVDAWREVLGRLDEAGDTAHLVQTALRFASVSPQAANLALNTVEELRTDWVNLLLGGENSRWSNFELAEATARLMTGRAVRGLLADSVGGGRSGSSNVELPTAPVLPDEAIHSGVRRRVLHAMELVARPGGTGGRLAPAIERIRNRVREADPARPYELYAFAKTGTPAVEKFVSSAQQELVERLVADSDLAWNGRIVRSRSGLEDEVRNRFGTGTLRWLQEDVIAPLEADPRSFREGVDGRLPAHPLYLTSGGILRAQSLTDLRVDRQGGVLILGLLAVPEGSARERASRDDDWISACSLDSDLRRSILEVPASEAIDPEDAVGLSVAVYLDDLAPGQGSGFAVDLALEMLDDVGDYLEGEVRARLNRLR